jgi:hypothetical protein
VWTACVYFEQSPPISFTSLTFTFVQFDAMLLADPAGEDGDGGVAVAEALAAVSRVPVT